MGESRNKPLSWIFVSWMMGIICFLIIVVLANFLVIYITNPYYNSAVTVLNENVWLLIIIALVLLIADIFGVFAFPLNLPAPLIRAIGIVFLIVFILRVIQWGDAIAATNLYPPFSMISVMIVPFVFLIVLVAGYYQILFQLGREPDIEYEEGDVAEGEYYDTTLQPLTDARSWEEIGDEFRLMLYDIIHRFRADIRRKK